MNLHSIASQVAKTGLMPATLPGLPAVGLGGRHGIGATQTSLQAPPPFVAVQGQPSVRLQKISGGGVVTTLRRNARDADNLTEADLNNLRRIANGIRQEAQALSQGPLSLQQLAQRGHPYGRGITNPRGVKRRGLGRLQGSRAGVSNLAVVNQQSGDFAASWEVEIERDKNGVSIMLKNTSEYAAELALGTARMRAHGPFTTAMVGSLGRINAEWLRLSRMAWAREQALAQVQAQVQNVTGT